MVDVEVLGPASWNTLIHLDRLPEPRPQTVFARSAVETLGGTSAGKALHLADLGRPVSLTTVVGDDPAGRSVTDALDRAGLAVDRVAAVAGTERHTNLMTREGARLSIYLTLPEPAPGALGQVTTTLAGRLASTRAVVADLAGWTLEVARRARVPREMLWTDLHDYDGHAEFHGAFADAASHVFLNADGTASPGDLMHRLVDRGARVVVCTLGADGARAVDADHREWSVPASPVAEIVDTNGAGDGFLAGFLHATLDGADIGAALTAGARQAARALGSWHLNPLLDAGD
ncbi:carbohydrate kinase family protein [Ornithinimicrobium sp. F0845]|uniref:carbohydrate kinase family protein n=1 Tax=Ornithinimicrobium sp. F0845 TaxID=2926412 RepID=UPI001FF22F5A|nr:carbohydrate kinase family protein [Ornithinimicrobium sp. F0845]MCK0112878.1 carbohydrate kinase family protein [Ornithinimicrobium sp. F0845]